MIFIRLKVILMYRVLIKFVQYDWIYWEKLIKKKIIFIYYC